MSAAGPVGVYKRSGWESPVIVDRARGVTSTLLGHFITLRGVGSAHEPNWRTDVMPFADFIAEAGGPRCFMPGGGWLESWTPYHAYRCIYRGGDSDHYVGVLIAPCECPVGEKLAAKFEAFDEDTPEGVKFVSGAEPCVELPRRR